MLGFTKFKINRLVNRRELYSNFSYNKWNQLDTGSKWKCLQQLENHFAAEQGRPAVKVLPISSKEVRGDYGGYDPDKNVIYINRDLVEYGTLVGPVDINHPTQLDANMQLFDTIAHEGYVNNNYGEDSSLSGIVLSENEQLVRQYHCSSVKQPRCEGYLSVTTRRMIFQAEGGTFFRSRISKEISLDKVTGVDCYYGVNMKITQIIVGVILTILGFYAWGISSSYIGSGRFYSFLIMILGIVLIVSGIRKSFKLTIYASECSPSPINIGEGALSLQGNAVFYAIVSEPTSDTDRMMNEVGALVHDLQTMGDMAVSKWKN